MTELLNAPGLHAFEQLQHWAFGACEAAVAENRETLMVAVADLQGSVHVWPLDWERLANDQNAFSYCRGELAQLVEDVGDVAHAFVVPAWMGEDGTLWALAPDAPQPSHDYRRVVVLSAACPRGQALSVGFVESGPPRCVTRWERMRTSDRDRGTLELRHTVAL
ncbi:MAG: hypothetical protein KDC36_01180 [Thermoleophilia bacterium]|nr:hypothetical protein [Thermoleophilia bacterium]